MLRLNIPYFYFKNSLKIHEENTKENHNRVVSLNVIKTRVTILNFSSSFLQYFSPQKTEIATLTYGISV